MHELKSQLKTLLVDALMLEEIDPAQIGDEEALFGPEGLGLDSVDALELVLEVQRKYGVTVDDSEEGRKVLMSVQSLAEHVNKRRIIV